MVLNGVNIKEEKAVTDLYNKIVHDGGEYLNETDSNRIFISDKTAELLRIKNYGIPVSYIDSLEKTGAPYPDNKKTFIPYQHKIQYGRFDEKGAHQTSE